MLERLSERIPVRRVNADEDPDETARYEVLSLPTVVLLVDGEPHSAVVGVRKLDFFESWLAEVLPAAERGLDA